jgi:hypothetical protein
MRAAIVLAPPALLRSIVGVILLLFPDESPLPPPPPHAEKMTLDVAASAKDNTFDFGFADLLFLSVMHAYSE